MLRERLAEPELSFGFKAGYRCFAIDVARGNCIRASIEDEGQFCLKAESSAVRASESSLRSDSRLEVLSFVSNAALALW